MCDTTTINATQEVIIKPEPENDDLEITYVKKENLPEKTKVKLIINKDHGNPKMFGIFIRKASNNVTLVDVKQHLMSQPRKYNNFDVEMYEYTVQTTDEDGIEGFEDCDEDDEMAVLPQFGNMIVLKCWLKS